MADGGVLARGVMTVTGARVLGLIFSLVQVKLAVTYLGPTGYGLLMTATLFVNSFGAWTELGMGNVVVRRVSGRGMDLQRQVGLSMTVSMLIVFPMVMVANMAARLLYADQPLVQLGIAILSVGLIASTWALRYAPVAQVHSRFGHYAAADLIGRALSLALVGVTVAMDLGLVWFFLAQLMVPVGQMIAMTRLGKLIGGFRPVWNRREMWDLLRETLPMTYIAAVGVLYFTIDGVMLSQLSTTEQVGAYGMAYRIVGNFTIVSASIASVLAARFAQDAATERAAFTTTIRSSLQAVLIVAAPLAVLVMGLAPDVIILLGSKEMAGLASGPLGLVAIGVGIGMMSAVMSAALIADYQQRILTILNTANLLLNITANIVLIPMYGATGAAISLIMSETSGFVICLALLIRRYGQCLPVGTVLRLVPALAVGLATEALIDGHWGVRILLVGLAYGLGLLVFRVVALKDVRTLMKRGG
ncbi:oligosaccharide flippase family protein [Mobilicoccus caccae]|uniref:oligosaccharide flippase family protein n=1 Tax=Mobilicoccus caccae TaxID=1859295 RepID=UPI0024E0EB4D|nr:oligosaccharide flippase family protein [Mobilicoccus caccae]